MDPIQERLFDLLQEKTGRRPSLSDSFADLGIDSLTMAELLCELETRFGVRTDESVLDLADISELCAYISDLSRQSSRREPA